MGKRSGRPLNTRQGGHREAPARMRGITANPDGSREERRAAKKLGVAKVVRVVRPEFDLAIPDDELAALAEPEQSDGEERVS